MQKSKDLLKDCCKNVKIKVYILYFFPASVVCSYTLQIAWIQIRPDEILGPDLRANCLARSANY